MKLLAAIGASACLLGWAGLANAQAKVCDNPRQMQGFKTCANVEKAEAEGAFVLYSTDPEAGQAKLVAAFNSAFPKIKANYFRLQAGALYGRDVDEHVAATTLRLDKAEALGGIEPLHSTNCHAVYSSFG